MEESSEVMEGGRGFMSGGGAHQVCTAAAKVGSQGSQRGNPKKRSSP